MKTIEVSKRAQAVNKLLREAREQTLLLRTADGAEFIVAEIDDFEREIELTRGNADLMEYLTHRRQERKRIPIAKVRRRLGC